jgi:hypothetical protein
VTEKIESIDVRFRDLIAEGDEHVRNHFAPGKVMDTRLAHGWSTATLNLIHLVTRGRGPYYEQAVRTVEDAGGVDLNGKSFAPVIVTASKAVRMHGILLNIYKDWQAGLLRQFEYIVSAENFDQFLRQAEQYHKSGKHIEAGVLVSAVFEDALKKVAHRNGINSSGLTSQEIINSLRDHDFITPVHARRLEGAAALRNKALHAEWTEFDLRDVGSAIRTVDELIQQHLDR